MVNLNEWIKIDTVNGTGNTIVNLTIAPNYDNIRNQRIKIQGLKKTIYLDIEQEKIIDYGDDYFYMEFDELTDTTNYAGFLWNGNRESIVEIDLEYSYDGINFYDCQRGITSSDEVWVGTYLTNENKKIFFRNNTKRINFRDLGYGCYYKFFTEGVQSFSIGGNILSLSDLTESSFENCFLKCTYLVDASRLKFPETTAENCYVNMFNNCDNLKYAPQVLPAKEVADYAYWSMFYSCQKLETTPLMLAEKFGYLSCWEMFFDCTSLVTATDFPNAELGSGCFANMFQNCTSLVTAPKLPSLKMAESCYGSMFSYCTNLVNPPELPSSELANVCYSYMFEGCTSLVESPELPAEILKPYCYEYMFLDCSRLKNITMLALDVSASNCISQWVVGVSSSGTFYKRAETTLREGNNGIPWGWKVVNI